MRLLVVVNVYDPDLGGGVLFADLCKGLARRGIDVQVRCAFPYYPEWRDKSGSNGMRILESQEHGVTVRRHGIYIPSRPGNVVPRLLYEASFFGSLARDIPEPGEFDLVMAFCPLMGGVAFGALAAKSIGCPLWLNVQDLSAEAAAAAGIVKSRSLGSLFQRIQQFLFNRADVWSTISPVMQDVLEPVTAHGQSVHLIPNWLHDSLAKAIASCKSPRGQALNTIPKLLYSGNIGGKQDLLLFCQLLADLQAPFEFRIQGDGTEASRLREWLSVTGDSRFAMHPLSDEAGLAKALKDSDLFVITEKKGSGGSFIPSKLLPALGSGTPVLAISDSQSPLGREMNESGAGLSCSWEELDQAFDLLSNPDRLGDVLPGWRAAATARSHFFDREHNIDRFALLMQDLAQTGT